MNKFVIASAAVVAMAAPSFAGGPTVIAADPVPAYAPTPVAAHDWSGPYVGLSFGRISGEFVETDFVGIVRDYSQGRAVGGFAGFNIQRGQLVYGAELGYSSVSDVSLVGGGGDDTLDSLLELKGRLGYAVGKALIYGAAGYSRGEWTVNRTGGGTLSGTSLGVGVDLAVTQTMFVGIDYTSRRMDGSPEAIAGGILFNVDTTTNSIGLRLGLSF
jgi:outer membrane immunogenic protein